MLLITLTATLFQLTAYASPRITLRSCDHDLTGDQRLARWAKNDRSAEAEAARSRLLNQAWWPVMELLEEIIRETTDEEIVALARRWTPALDLNSHAIGTEESQYRMRTAREAGYQFDAAYAHRYLSGPRTDLPDRPELPLGLSVPHNDFNRDFMRRVFITAGLFMRLIHRHGRELAEEFPVDNRRVLRNHSFTGLDAGLTLLLAVDTIVQSFALTTASPIGHLEPESIARLGSAGQNYTSVLDRVALGLPPGLVGRYGRTLYVEGAVASEADGRLRLTGKMIRFMKGAKSSWRANRSGETYELGFGCPLAYPSPEGGARTGVGVALDIFWRLYDRIPISL